MKVLLALFYSTKGNKSLHREIRPQDGYTPMKRSTLLCLLFGGFFAHMAYGADKFRVQVVETTGSITTSKLGVSTDATAKVILPNGDHAALVCSGRDGHCAKVVPFAPEKMRPDATACSTVGDVFICVTHDLGEFVASRKGNELTIEAPNGKLKFEIIGSW